MLSERMPGRRLITQNMLASAALFEADTKLNWQSIQDLAAFIDLFCLYDKVIVIGRGADSALHDWQSDFFGLLRDSHFVDIDHPGDEVAESVTKAATGHLLTFLGEEDSARFQRLLSEALTPSEVHYGLHRYPDSGREVEIGQEWLLTTPTRFDLLEQLKKEQDVARGTTFLIRTFLYLAYADVTKTAFTPDAVRCPVLEIVLDKEEQFRGKLLAHLKKSFEEDTLGDQEMLRAVSPFAAVVFQRAGKDRSRIVAEMKELRENLTKDRKELQSIEDRALYGTRGDAIKAKGEWNRLVDEIVTSFGVTNPLQITFRYLLNLSEGIGKIADTPGSWGAWSKLVSLPIHLVNRITARKTTVGIHRTLQTKRLPGSGALLSSIRHLFGDIEE